jgi:hypothetical protein
MSFNHRVMRHRDLDGTFVYQVHEVFYDDDGKIDGWSSGPAKPCGESLGELMRDLQHMRDALALPVLCAKRGKDVEPPLQVEEVAPTKPISIRLPEAIAP